jgi:hypothetical protein
MASIAWRNGGNVVMAWRNQRNGSINNISNNGVSIINQ